MKSKSLKFVFASIFLALLLVGIASALTLSSSSLTFNNNDSKTITVAGNTSAILYNSSFTVGTIVFFVDETSAGVLTITPQDDIKELDFNEEYAGSFSVGDDSETKTVTVKVSNSNFCEYSDIGYLNIEIDDWRVSGYGDDEEWFPLDTIEIDLEVSAGDYDLEDVEIEWGLYDEENEQWLIEVDDEDEFDLDEDDDEKITFSFTLDKSVDLDDFEDLLNSGTVTLYVRATGTVDDNGAGSDDGKKTCVSNEENFEIVVEKDFVILKDVEMPDSVSCNSQLQISGEVWNIGSKDQDDIDVKIVIPELDIEEYIEIEELEKDFDKEEFSLTLEFPEDVQAGSYTVKFYVLDEDGDIYEADNDDELSTFSKSFTVVGDCSTAKVSVSATLQEGGKAGKPLVVKATIVNSGDSQGTFTLNIADYASWAELSEVSKSTLVLSSGQSEDVLITLNTNKDVSGEQTFNVEVLSEGKLVANQPVSVSLTGRSSLSSLINGNNWQIWAIGALNLILVIIIIIVAIRIARK